MNKATQILIANTATHKDSVLTIKPFMIDGEDNCNHQPEHKYKIQCI
jgi:hypothetical protein